MSVTNLTALINNVYTLTNRNDLVNETLLAVQQATLLAHRAEYYPRDLYETPIKFSSADYLQQMERSTISNFRKIKYLRKYDSVNDAPGMFLEPVELESVFDKKYMRDKTDIFYLAGAAYQIKSSTAEQYFLLGAYVYPDVTATGYSSWIGEEYPFLVVYTAAANVCGIIGQTELKSHYQNLSSVELNIMNADCLETANI